MAGEVRIRIQLKESVRIAGAGHAKTTWVVRVNDDWMLAAQYPGAETEMVDAGPGTVWERWVELDVPVGSLVKRVCSSPGNQPPRDVLGYLLRDSRAVPRRVTRQVYRVSSRGELLPVADPPP